MNTTQIHAVLVNIQVEEVRAIPQVTTWPTKKRQCLCSALLCAIIVYLRRPQGIWVKTKGHLAMYKILVIGWCVYEIADYRL